jgi:type II secretory pathway component PulF
VMPKSDSLALGTLSAAKNVPKALRELAEGIERQNEMTAMVRKALVSPMILLPIAFGFAYILATFTIPEFVKAAPAEVWNSAFLSLVRDSAQALKSYGLWVAGLVVFVCIWTFVWALANFTQDWRYSMERSRGRSRFMWILVCPLQPVFALYRDIEGTKMLSNLANLMQSGKMLNDAVIELAEYAQPWMRRHLAIIHAHLQLDEGDHVGAFSHGVLPIFLLSRMSSMVRQEPGGFDRVLVELGTLGMKEARESVEKSATTINVSLLVITLSVICFFYFGQGAIVTAIQDANSPTAVMRRNVLKQQENAARAALSAPANSRSP